MAQEKRVGLIDKAIDNYILQILETSYVVQMHPVSILSDLEKASSHVQQEGVLRRLALAIALEHAVPIAQNNPKQTSSNTEAFVDPVRR